MTEEQAKTKWCPFVRLTASQGEWHTSRDPSLPSAPDDTQAYRCIASACMAWRRQTVMIDRATGEPAVPGVTAIGQLEERYSDRGFCGLAGQPS